MRKLPKWIDILLIPLINLTIALFLSALVVLYIGEDPMDALSIMIKGAIGSSYGWGYTLYYATNFIFTGLLFLWHFMQKCSILVGRDKRL